MPRSFDGRAAAQRLSDGEEDDDPSQLAPTGISTSVSVGARGGGWEEAAEVEEELEKERQLDDRSLATLELAPSRSWNGLASGWLLLLLLLLLLLPALLLSSNET
jgi:hypothetical protein